MGDYKRVGVGVGSKEGGGMGDGGGSGVEGVKGEGRKGREEGGERLLGSEFVLVRVLG